jgi:hypothetical protein
MSRCAGYIRLNAPLWRLRRPRRAFDRLDHELTSGFSRGNGHAVALTLWFLRIFGKIELRGARGSKRYLQLNRPSKHWQVKADQGEIPQTTASGPRVWRDELDEANTQGT